MCAGTQNYSVNNKTSKVWCPPAVSSVLGNADAGEEASTCREQAVAVCVLAEQPARLGWAAGEVRSAGFAFPAGRAAVQLSASTQPLAS